MNIVEAYIKFNKKLIILISGLSGCGKTGIGREISRDFKLPLINENEYCVKHFDNKVTLPDGKVITNWDSDDIYNWDKLNADIMQSGSCVIVGTAFPDDKLKFNVDFHVHIKLSKQNIVTRRERFKTEHDDCGQDELTHDETFVLNKYTLPYYYDLLKRETKMKYINANEIAESENDDNQKYIDKLYDEVFNYLMSVIQERLGRRSSTGSYKETREKPQEETDSTTIDEEPLSTSNIPTEEEYIVR